MSVCALALAAALQPAAEAADTERAGSSVKVTLEVRSWLSINREGEAKSSGPLLKVDRPDHTTIYSSLDG